MNIGAWSFVGLAAGSLVTVVLGVPWTTYIARRHTSPATWSTPLFRETNVVMTLGWALIFLAAAGVVAWTPLWVQPIVGAILYGLGRVSPCLAARYAARRARHGYGSSPLIHQTPRPLEEKIHLCRFNEKS